MTTTELIKILKDNECGGITHKPRELSLTINGKYMPNPQITLSSTGDGICGAEIDLDVDGEFIEEMELRWIPVSERLPEDSELILFSTKTDRVFEGRYFADNTDRQWYAFRDETFAWNNVVTAWMPLPKPYEPQERSNE